METPEKCGTPAQGNIKIEVGDVVKILGNAVNTTWEYGVVVSINEKGALIDYNYPLEVYGLGNRKQLYELESMENDK